jgi:type IV pilus assembly protein PilP
MLQGIRRRIRRNKMWPRNLFTIIFLAVMYALFYVTGLLASEEINPTVPKEEKGALPRQEPPAPHTDTEEESKSAPVYDPTGKTDPFKSFIAEQEPVEEEKRKKPKTYLETLELSQLDLIAIILSPKGNWAMVRDAKGLGYVIRKGTPIGTNEGIVHQIREKEVVVREQLRDFRGRVKTKDTIKKLLSQQ